MSVSSVQDKQQEIDFFNAHAAADSYNVFSEAANHLLISQFAQLSGLPNGAKVLDLGCGSGIFTRLLSERGYKAEGLDISPKLIELARQNYPTVPFLEGDVEALPYDDESVDGLLLSGLVHHLPDPRRCASEAFRVLRKGGRFMAFDLNRANPFMYLYRDRSSPFYSSFGVTPNERPVLAREMVSVFTAAGFVVSADYLSGLSYRYVASPRARVALPIYNFIDSVLFKPSCLKRYSPFVLTYGAKP